MVHLYHSANLAILHGTLMKKYLKEIESLQDDQETLSVLTVKLPRVDLNELKSIITSLIMEIRTYPWTSKLWSNFLNSLPEGLVSNSSQKDFDIYRDVITNNEIAYIIELEIEMNVPPFIIPEGVIHRSIWDLLE